MSDEEDIPEEDQSLIDLLADAGEPDEPVDFDAPINQSEQEQLEETQDCENGECPQVEEPELIENPERELPPNISLSEAESGGDGTLIAQFGHVLGKFSESVDKMLQNQEHDRSQVEDAIALIKRELQGRLSEPGAKYVTPLLDNYVKALEVKANINANGSRALDSVAKLMAAIKNNDIVVSIQGGKDIGSSGLDLEAFLSQDPKEDE